MTTPISITTPISTTAPLLAALTDFYQDTITLWQKNDHIPSQPFDPEWYSPCFCAEPEQLEVGKEQAWQPVNRKTSVSFYNIENALNIALDKQIDVYFGSYYSDHMPALFNGEAIELVQVWSDDDFERLQENMIAHLMMKKKLKQSPTLFIATCEDDMDIIAIDNVSGEVVKERLGKGISAVLAPDLASFIAALTPQLLD